MPKIRYNLIYYRILFEMCDCSVRSYNRSRFIPLTHPHRFIQYFPCGYCSDCIRQKKQEYSLRTQYEAKACFSKNGFALFDTLTYRDDNLKRYHDICGLPYYHNHYDVDCMAFSRDDVKKFFKLLRVRLDRAGYDVGGNLKYLLTSEYGTSERCTHRPHYHVVFFVTFQIDPLVLSRFISDAWIHGRTDGVVFKGSQYVLYNRVFRNSVSHLNALCNYVCKYVTKDLYVHKKLYKRALRYVWINFPSWFESYQGRLKLRAFLHRVLPFHLQSNGYGISFLEDVEQVEYVNNTGLVRFSTFDKYVVRSVSLPLYFRRKLYQYCEWFDGRLRWRLNDLGLKIQWKRYLDNKTRLIASLRAWDSSLHDVDLLAEYQLLWRGLLINKFDLDLSEREIFDRIYDPLRYNTSFYHKNKLLLYCYSNERENYRRGKYIANVYCSDKIDGIIQKGLFSSLVEFEQQPFLKDWIVISSLNVQRFAGLDDILSRYYDFLFYNSYQRSEYQQKIDAARFRLKQVFS